MVLQYPPPKKLKLAVLQYFVHLILTKSLRLEKRANSFTPIWSKILKSTVYNYEDYVRYLKKQEVIQVTKSYRPGVYCKGMRISIRVEGLRYTEIKDSRLLDRINRKKRSYRSLVIPWYLKKWFNDKLKLDQSCTSITSVDPIYCEWILKRMDNCAGSLSRSDRNGRLSSVLTNMKRGLRELTSYEERSLVSIDIASCHPYLVANLILNENFYQLPLSNTTSSTSYLTLYRLIETYTYKTQAGRDRTDVPINVAEFVDQTKAVVDEIQRITCLDANCNDLKQFKELVNTSQLRSYLGNLYLPGESEKRIKKAINIALAKRRRLYYKGCREVEEAFPSVFSVLRYFKDDGEFNRSLPWYNRKKPHATISVMLQFVESYLVIDKVCSRISKDHPEIPIFTVHDCILTTPENETIVREYMGKVIEALVGVKPKLKSDKIVKQSPAAVA